MEMATLEYLELSLGPVEESLSHRISPWIASPFYEANLETKVVF